MFGKKAKAVLTVEGMTCQHCENRVKQALNDIKGVRSVDIDLDSGKTSVAFNSKRTDINSLVDAVKQAGYEVISSEQVDA